MKPFGKRKKIIETPVMLLVFSLLILGNAFKPTNKNRADESNFEILYGWGPCSLDDLASELWNQIKSLTKMKYGAQLKAN